MTKAQFETITRDLEAFYEKSLNPTQMQIWFEELKDYSSERYKQAVIHVCKTSQYKPTLSMMLDAINTVKIVNTQAREQVECKACKGTGYILYHKVIDGRDYEYACQCNCKNAIGLDYDGTKIADKQHRSNYYLAKAVDVFATN